MTKIYNFTLNISGKLFIWCVAIFILIIFAPIQGLYIVFNNTTKNCAMVIYITGLVFTSDTRKQMTKKMCQKLVEVYHGD